MAELNGAEADTRALQMLALVNYGHFTSMRIESGSARGLSLHLDRLTRDCRALFNADLDRDEVRKLIRQVSSHSAAEFINLRVTVFDPDLEMGNPGAEAIPHFLVTATQASADPFPAMRVTRARYSRESPSVKHVGLFGTIRLRREAQLRGFDDVLFTEADGSISEGATWNVGFFDGVRVIWPKADVLNGVTMQLIKATHPGAVVRAISVSELPAIQAAFATNVSIGVRPISEIDGIKFDPDHPILTELQAKYLAVTPEII